MTSELPKKPWWLFPNLLSLDAPLVAVAWLAVFAKTWRLVYHPWEAYVALGLVVWIIYVVDRLIDASLRKDTPERCEPRHLFHWKYRKAFAASAGLAGVAALFLVIRYMPYSIFGYLFVAVVLIGAFFGLSLLSQQDANEIPYMKNILAGLTFAYGVGLLASVYNQSADFYLTMRSREMICFAVLCIMNISAIDLWEHANRSQDTEIKATDELALTLPLVLLGLSAIVFAYQANPHPEDVVDYGLIRRSFFYSILTGAALLYVLNRTRNRFHMDTLRVLADVALLIPVLVFFASSKEPQG
ncbi:MAG: hypothetical protein KF712_02550 [Akkermansiaceae bacterium]|nr:hypothetical protein [Akkermansiaceae bacterium]